MPTAPGGSFRCASCVGVACVLRPGVVYRCKDNALVVAVDEVPDEGMDQPLRLEKLANEV